MRVVTFKLSPDDDPDAAPTWTERDVEFSAIAAPDRDDPAGALRAAPSTEDTPAKRSQE